MASVFSKYQFPLIVQTCDSETLADIRERSKGQIPDCIPPFYLTREEDAALFILLIRLKEYIEKMPDFPNVKTRVFIDEGYRKNGVIIKIPTFETVFSEGFICFCQSCTIKPIQLADYAAFSLNRSQLIGGRGKRNSLDKRLLQILSRADFNYLNIEKRTISLDKEGPLITLDDTRPHGPR